ncbi:hypothetical protein ACTG9Q_28585 [Actinokineospora sp. 24-640]
MSDRRRWVKAIVLLPVLSAVFALSGSSSAEVRDEQSGDRRLVDQLLSVRDMSGYYPTGNHPLRPDEIIAGTGSYIEEVRDGSVVAAHQRVFVSFDGSHTVAIRLTEAPNGDLAAVLGGLRDAGGLEGFDAPRVRVVREPTNDGTDNRAVHAVRGRVLISVTSIWSRAAVRSDPPAVESTLRALGNEQYAKVADSADLTQQSSISVRSAQVELYFTVLGTIGSLQLLAWFAVSLADRGTREHLAKRFIPQRPRPVRAGVRVDDVSARARQRAKAHRFGVLARGALFIVVFTAAYRLKAVEQLLLFASVGLVVSLAGIVRAKRGGRSRFRATHGFGSSALVVLAGTIGIALAGLGLELITVAAVSRLGVPGGIPAEGVKKLSELTLFSGVLVFALADVPYRLARRVAARQARRALERDGRDEILLLRSFLDDGVTIRARRTNRQSLLERLALRRRERFEELMVWSLWKFGPVGALGEPNTKLPPLGAAREFFGADWFEIVVEKIRAYRCVVLVVGRTKGLVDEVEAVRRQGALGRAIFVLPPVPRAEAGVRLEVLAAALGLDATVFPPQDLLHPGVLVLRFDGDGTPHLIVSNGRDDTSYLLAIEQAAVEVFSATRTHLSSPAPAVSAPERLVGASLLRSPSPRQARIVRWQRRWITWPWIASIVLTFLGSVLVATSPTTAPLPPMPGTVVASVELDFTLSAAGNEVVGVNRADRQLLAVRGDRSTVLYRFAEVPHLLATSGGTVFATTFGPYQLLALRKINGDYREVWRTGLPARAAAVEVAAGRVAVALPGIDTVVTADAGTGSGFASLSVPGGPWSLAGHQDHLLVGSLSGMSVTRVDLATNSVVEVVPTVISPAVLKVEGDALYVGSVGDSAIVKLSLFDDRLLGRVDVERFNGVMALGSRHLAVGTYHRTAKLVMLDLATLTTTSTTDLPSEAVELFFVEPAYYVTAGALTTRVVG